MVADRDRRAAQPSEDVKVTDKLTGPRSSARRADAGAEAPRVALKDEAYGQILEGVRSGEFAPGSEVTESQLAARFGFGKAPIRTALTRLVQEGWLQPLPRRGHRVKPLTIADTRDLFLTRKLVEPFTARLAAGRLDEDRRRQLEAAANPDHGAWKGMDGEQVFFAANREFHVGIANAAGSPRLAAIVAALHSEAERVLRYGMRQYGLGGPDLLNNWARGHVEILDALVAGDADAAERIARRQLESSERVVIEALRRETDKMPI